MFADGYSLAAGIILIASITLGWRISVVAWEDGKGRMPSAVWLCTLVCAAASTIGVHHLRWFLIGLAVALSLPTFRWYRRRQFRPPSEGLLADSVSPRMMARMAADMETYAAENSSPDSVEAEPSGEPGEGTHTI